MNDFDNELRDALRRSQARAEAGHVTDFDSAWSRAESTASRAGKRSRFMGGIAAAAALIAIVFIMQVGPPEQQWQFVDPDEFASSTSWVAPSDVLLPQRQFDIYGEIPVLIESTERDGGTLL